MFITPTKKQPALRLTSWVVSFTWRRRDEHLTAILTMSIYTILFCTRPEQEPLHRWQCQNDGRMFLWITALLQYNVTANLEWTLMNSYCGNDFPQHSMHFGVIGCIFQSVYSRMPVSTCMGTNSTGRWSCKRYTVFNIWSLVLVMEYHLPRSLVPKRSVKRLNHHLLLRQICSLFPGIFV